MAVTGDISPLVNRRVGGLEVREADLSGADLVNRRVGGLEELL